MEDYRVQKIYDKVLNNKYELLKRIHALDTENSWQFEKEANGVIIHSFLDPTTQLKIIRSQGLIKAPPKEIIGVASNINASIEWDQTLEKVNMLYKSEPYNIIHTVVKKMFVVAQRDSVIISRHYYDDDGTIYAVATSINYPFLPEISGIVRATIHLIGWVMKPCPENPEMTDFISILHVDPKGWIPKTIFNWFAQEQGLNLRKLADYVEKLHGEAKDNDEDKENIAKHS